MGDLGSAMAQAFDPTFDTAIALLAYDLNQLEVFLDGFPEA
jgi:hypothetical protein